MDSTIGQKKQELYHILADIEAKINGLENKGLSATLYDHRKALSLVDEMRTSCENDSASLQVGLETSTEQSSKDQSLRKGFEKYNKDEKRRLDGYKENVTTYSNMSKKYVSEINVKKLKPLIKKGNVNDLFKYLFSLLYKMPESEYNPTVFAKQALDKDSDDFQSKLASFNTTDFHADQDKVEKFKRVKDQQFPEAEKSIDLNNLLNWMDYIYEMYLAELEFKQQEQNMKKNQSEYGERLLHITLAEENNRRRRQALTIYKEAINQLDIDKKLFEKKRELADQAGSNLKINKKEFLDHLERFKKQLYDNPNHF